MMPYVHFFPARTERVSKWGQREEAAQTWDLGGLGWVTPTRKPLADRPRWGGAGKRKGRVKKVIEDRAGSHHRDRAVSCVQKAVVSYEGSCPG